VNALHKKQLTIIAFAVILITVLLTVYLVQNINYNANSSTQSGAINGLKLSLTLDSKTATYKQGQAINVTVALTNISNKALNLSFSNSYLCFDVRNSENISVYGQDSPIQPNGILTLAPQRSVSDILNWNTGPYRYGSPASIGVYQIVGYFSTDFNSTRYFQTAPLNITITNGSTPTPSSQL
jgi:hypothetical protein